MGYFDSSQVSCMIQAVTSGWTFKCMFVNFMTMRIMLKVKPFHLALWAWNVKYWVNYFKRHWRPSPPPVCTMFPCFHNPKEYPLYHGHDQVFGSIQTGVFHKWLLRIVYAYWSILCGILVGRHWLSVCTIVFKDPILLTFSNLQAYLNKPTMLSLITSIQF